MINKNNILNVVLVVTSLLFIAGTCEIALSFYFKNKHGTSAPVCLQADEKLIYRLKANAEQCNTNAMGYFGRDYPQEKTGKRIVIIGDSVAAGVGVPYEKSFGKLFEKKLNAVFESEYEVIVLAVPGYSTSQEIVLLRDEVFQYNPDLIVVAYHLNDPAHPLFHNAGGQVGMYFKKPVSYTFFYLKRLLYRTKSRIKGIRSGCPNDPWSLFLHCVYWSDVKKNFREIMAISENNSTSLVFAFLPLLLDPVDGKGIDELYDRLGELAQESGAQSVNLMQAFQGYDMESVKLPDDAWHPNEIGHRIIAERIFSYFMDNSILISD
ncbi:MAG: SGNH/GDSL hydrolase family protein [Deltaproteobacteria bacterium]|nr:SGNH/GDSL hydrolase family protein [Deltaproteobacteria bacterium]